MRKIHRWLSTCAIFFLLFVAATGVILQIQKISGGDEDDPDNIHVSDALATTTPPTLYSAMLDRTLARARERAPGKPIVSITLRMGEQPQGIVVLAGDPGRKITVAARNGQVLTDESYEAESLIMRIHDGEIFGDTGVVLGVLWGSALVILCITGFVVYFDLYRRRAKLRGKWQIFWAILLLLVPLLFFSANKAQADDQPAGYGPLTGNILLTGNASTIDRPLPSLNEKLTLDYALPEGQVLDLRVENYYEGSFNQNPPGVLGHHINEHKFEIQATYTHPIDSIFSVSAAILHHENFTFQDNYEWAIGTVTAAIPLGDAVTLTTNLSLEKRLSGGRFFYDTATTLDYRFAPKWTFEAAFHRYENFGELDPEPTQKLEYEIGVIRQLATNQTVALSFFRHEQFGAPNDQFSFVKLKYGYSF